jgi:hypothetical protein
VDVEERKNVWKLKRGNDLDSPSCPGPGICPWRMGGREERKEGREDGRKEDEGRKMKEGR